jgi:cell shape-determining protein MreC
MEKYDTLKAWGIDTSNSVSKTYHERSVNELTAQVYKAYTRIKTLKEENTQLKDQLGI